MATKKKEKDEKAGEETAAQPIEKLVLDRTDGKYGIVPLAAVWAKELKKQQEFQHLSTAQVLEAALKDVLSGKVTWDTVEGLPKEESSKK
jgi:hypothetical protein